MLIMIKLHWAIGGMMSFILLASGLELRAQEKQEVKSAYRDPGSMEGLDNKRALRVGDVVYFRVIEDRDPATELVVTGSGDIDFPYIGKVRAEGKTAKQIAETVKPILEKDYYFTATPLISPGEARSRGMIYLAGQVTNPSPQEIPLSEVLTVSKAVYRAGLTSNADLTIVQVTRGDRSIPVNLEAIMKGGKVEQDLVLQADDVVIVSEAKIQRQVQVTGKIRSPGYVEILPGRALMVSDAILRSGGFDEFANDRKVRLMRTMPDGKLKEFTIDVKKVMEKGDAAGDMELQPGDKVFVPQKFINLL